MNGQTHRERSRGYGAGMLGALFGALLVGIPVGGASLFAVGRLVFSDVGGAVLIGISCFAASASIFGAALGTRWALERRRLPKSTATAVILAVLLAILFLVGVVSSGTQLQSKLFVPLTIAAPITPLVARWLALRRTRFSTRNRAGADPDAMFG